MSIGTRRSYLGEKTEYKKYCETFPLIPPGVCYSVACLSGPAAASASPGPGQLWRGEAERLMAAAMNCGERLAGMRAPEEICMHSHQLGIGVLCHASRRGGGGINMEQRGSRCPLVGALTSQTC